MTEGLMHGLVAVLSLAGGLAIAGLVGVAAVIAGRRGQQVGR